MRDGLAAVVGATGFIGSRLVERLSAAGHPLALYNRDRPPIHGGWAHAGLRDARIVYFLAAGLNPVLAARSPQDVVAEHTLLASVLEALAREPKNRPLVVLASSGGAVYAPDHPAPYRESTPTGPISAYGHAKLRLEQLLLSYSGWVDPLILRLSNVYGPGQRTARGYGVLPHWLTAAARDEPILLFGDPGVARDYVHVDDVARFLLTVHGFAAAGLAEQLPHIMNVGSGVATSLADLLELVRDVVGRDLDVRREKGRPFDRRSNWLDASLAARTLDWRTGIDLRDGVRGCWEYLGRPRAELKVTDSA